MYSTYFEGRPPKSINMYWRRFAVKDIPVNDAAGFEKWLMQRWAEKDELLEHYVTTGSFPEDESKPLETSLAAKPSLRKRAVANGSSDSKPLERLETEVKLARWIEVLENYTIIL